jgi:hypothetical protein
MEPTLMEPALMEPTLMEPALMEPALMEPTLMEPALMEPALEELGLPYNFKYIKCGVKNRHIRKVFISKKPKWSSENPEPTHNSIEITRHSLYSLDSKYYESLETRFDFPEGNYGRMPSNYEIWYLIDKILSFYIDMSNPRDLQPLYNYKLDINRETEFYYYKYFVAILKLKNKARRLRNKKRKMRMRESGLMRPKLRPT